MTFAAPWLLIVGGIFLGMTFAAFGRHKGLGTLTLILGITLIALGLSGSTLTVPKVHVNNPPVVPSHSASPSPSGSR